VLIVKENYSNTSKEEGEQCGTAGKTASSKIIPFIKEPVYSVPVDLL
jgi:hypothetical protein